MEITVGAAATPPMLTSKGRSPGGTSRICTLSCRRPTKPGAKPANWTKAIWPPILTTTRAMGVGNGGLDGATSPVIAGGFSTSPWPVRYAVTYCPGRAGVCAALRFPSARAGQEQDAWTQLLHGEMLARCANSGTDTSVHAALGANSGTDTSVRAALRANSGTDTSVRAAQKTRLGTRVSGPSWVSVPCWLPEHPAF